MMDFDRVVDERRQGLEAKGKQDLAAAASASKQKEIRFSCNITDHDASVKAGKVEKMLRQGLRVKVSIFFAPPIPFDAELGEALMESILDGMDQYSDMSELEVKSSRKQGEVFVFLDPLQKKKKKRKKDKVS